MGTTNRQLGARTYVITKQEQPWFKFLNQGKTPELFPTESTDEEGWKSSKNKDSSNSPPVEKILEHREEDEIDNAQLRHEIPGFLAVIAAVSASEDCLLTLSLILETLRLHGNEPFVQDDRPCFLHPVTSSLSPRKATCPVCPPTAPRPGSQKHFCLIEPSAALKRKLHFPLSAPLLSQQTSRPKSPINILAEAA